MSGPEVLVLDVQLHGESIGNITRTSGNTTLFSFNRSYIDSQARDTLGLSFKTAAGELRTELRPYRMRLMPFFSNMLPEGPLRGYLADKGGVHPEREALLLWLLGEDLPGAVRVRAPDGTALLPRHAREDAGAGPGARIFRYSLAGMQLKFSAIARDTGGLAIPPMGVGGSWILKLPSDTFENVPENEYSMMTLARLTGIAVPLIKLVPLGGVELLPMDFARALKGSTALAVERFDRRADGSRVHTEDFAQIFELYPQDKYGKASSMSIARVLRAEAHDDDLAEFIRRLVFNALIGNADMHVKNWSVIYPDRRRARLAPAYDFLNTTAYIRDPHAGLKFSRTRRYEELTLGELAHLARRAQIPEGPVLEAARQMVDRFRQVWSKEKVHLPLASSVIAAVERQLAVIPLARAAAG